jgi:hypothetical protein
MEAGAGGNAKLGEARVDRNVLRLAIVELTVAVVETGATGAGVVGGAEVPAEPLVDVVPLEEVVALEAVALAVVVAEVPPSPAAPAAGSADATGTTSPEQALSNAAPAAVAAIFKNSRRESAMPAVIGLLIAP